MASRFCVCIAMAEDQLFSGESKNMNERLNAILIQHTGSLHRFSIFHNILFVNKQKQEKYICLKLHIKKSDCHPLN